MPSGITKANIRYFVLMSIDKDQDVALYSNV